MKVYVVSSGERYEGGGIDKIFDSYEKARAHALLKVEERLSYHPRVREDTAYGKDGGPDVPNGTELYDNYWVINCDFIEVETFDVE